jgi:single-strand DNA-binding protein
MASFNKVILLGNVTRDPEVRYTPKSQAVVDLGMAMNRKYTTESGERREEVTFVDVTFWGKQAENIGQYCHKGKSVMVVGRLQLDTWADKETGQHRSKLRVVGEEIQFLGSPPGNRGDDDDGQYSPAEPRQPQYAAPQRPTRPSSAPTSGRPPMRHQPARPAALAPEPPPEDDDVPF